MARGAATHPVDLSHERASRAMQIMDKLVEICARFPSNEPFALPRRVQAAWRLPQVAWMYEH